MKSLGDGTTLSDTVARLWISVTEVQPRPQDL